MIGSAVLGLGLALISAVHPRGATDVLVRVISLAGNSLPIFWLGLLALYFFYARLGWFGGPGRLDDAYEYTIEMPTGWVLIDSWLSGVKGAFASAAYDDLPSGHRQAARAEAQCEEIRCFEYEGVVAGVRLSLQPDELPWQPCGLGFRVSDAG